LRQPEYVRVKIYINNITNDARGSKYLHTITFTYHVRFN